MELIWKFQRTGQLRCWQILSSDIWLTKLGTSEEPNNGETQKNRIIRKQICHCQLTFNCRNGDSKSS